MLRTFGCRTIVFGLIVSLMTNPVWGIGVAISNPASGSSRPDTATVAGGGMVMLMGDHIDNYTWKFGFGTKLPDGTWVPELEEQVINVSDTNWSKLLQAPPWTLSPINPMMNARMPDHFARLTLTKVVGGNIFTYETNTHTVTI